MKRFISACFAVVLIAMPVRDANAGIDVSVFYETLQPYGEWIEAGDYGYCWRPNDLDQDWRPYTDGNWAYTDAGWTWVSDEPYSWAVYHYGRWAKIEDVGWVWVPDTEWGPAWVSWRRSDRHIGWAPLPPEARFHGEVRAISHWSDSYYDIGPSSYSFVEVRNFGAPRLRAVVIQPRENITIINETRNITNITIQNNVVFNGGLVYDVIVRESAQPIRRLKIERQTSFAGGDPRTVRPETFQTRVENNALRIFAPPIESSARVAPPKISRKLDRVQVNHGWKDIADQTEADKLRVKMKAEAPVPAALPPKAKIDRRIAAPGTPKTSPPETREGTTPAESAEAQPLKLPEASPQTRPGKTDSRKIPRTTSLREANPAPGEIPSRPETKPVTEEKPPAEVASKPPTPALPPAIPRSPKSKAPVAQPQVKKANVPESIPPAELPTKAPNPVTPSAPAREQIPPPAAAAPPREKKHQQPAREESRAAAPAPRERAPAARPSDPVPPAKAARPAPPAPTAPTAPSKKEKKKGDKDLKSR